MEEIASTRLPPIACLFVHIFRLLFEIIFPSCKSRFKNSNKNVHKQ